MIKQKPLYFDYMATTPVDCRVVERMVQYLGVQGDFGNAASTQHDYGQAAAKAVDNARLQIAQAVGCLPDEIVFTSGATEANNLAILGACRFYQRKGRHIITMSTEHKSVLDTVHHLSREGFEVTYLAPKTNGLLSLQALLDALRDDTIFVSIMHVNNEIGVIQDIAAIGQALRGKGIVFHVDAAQSAGRLPIDLSTLPVDLMSFSAHKSYGPKGIGALYVRSKPRIRLQAQTYGGGHENGLRSGTLATHQIVGMGEAFALAQSLQVTEQATILSLRQRLWDGIRTIPGIFLNGCEHQRIAGNLNVSLSGIDGSELLSALHGLAVSTTSACLSARSQPSYVLRALGLSQEQALSSIRLSFGRFTTPEAIDQAILMIHEVMK